MNSPADLIPGATPTPGQSAVERAIAFGVDISLLIENLRLTPTERVQRAQQRLNAIAAGLEPPQERWSLEKQIAELEALLELQKRPPKSSQ